MLLHYIAIYSGITARRLDNLLYKENSNSLTIPDKCKLIVNYDYKDEIP